MLTSWKKSYDQPRQHITKHIANSGPSSQGYGFSSSHVWMWELNCKESWVPKNWCFWTVVLEKTLESPLDYKEIQPVYSKGDQSWVFMEGLVLKLKLQYFGHLMWRVDSLEKTLMLGGIGEGGEGNDRGWDGWVVHWLDGHEFEWTLGAGDGQGGLACCHSWGRKELDTTERLNWTGEDSWESLGLQGDPTSPFWRRSALGFLWKEWC